MDVGKELASCGKAAPLYNLSYLERITDGEEVYLRKLVLEFLSEADKSLMEIRQLIVDKNIVELKAVVQHIKPHLFNFRIANISDDIRKIEHYKESAGWEDFQLIVLKFVTFVEIVLINMRKDLAL